MTKDEINSMLYSTKDTLPANYKFIYLKPTAYSKDVPDINKTFKQVLNEQLL